MKLKEITRIAQNTLVFRLLAPSDALTFRSLRLCSLQEAPAAHGATYEEESNISLERIESMLEHTDDSFVVGGFSNGALIAIAGLMRDRPLCQRHKAHVWGVYVCPDQRGNGIGKELMQFLMNQVRHMPGVIQASLYVDVENAVAISLYEQLGFMRFGIEPDAILIDDGYHDLLLMVARL